MRRLLFLLPVLLLAALAAGFAVPLLSGRDPGELPSALIDQPAPDFSLPPLPGRSDGFARADLGGRPVLVNVFASWCVPCLAELPLLMRLAREEGIPIYGINYKDAPEDALAWLARNGDPYARIGSDRDGRVGIEWGVYGVPETYVIDRDGRIRYRVAGPLSREILDRDIRPLLAELAK